MTVTAVPPNAEAVAEAPAKSRKKLMIIVVGVLLLGGAAYWFLLKPGGEAEPKEPEPGGVVTAEPIQVNLQGGHYLRLGLALQLTADAHEADASKALDAAIDIFSGLPMEKVTQPEQRKKLKKELEKELEHAYHGDVMGVYFTDFVTQ